LIGRKKDSGKNLKGRKKRKEMKDKWATGERVGKLIGGGKGLGPGGKRNAYPQYRWKSRIAGTREEIQMCRHLFQGAGKREGTTSISATARTPVGVRRKKRQQR